MIEHFTEFWQSQTSRLMLIYLAIIMAMSMTFSAIIYITSVNQLDRQLPGDSYVDEDGQFGPTPRVREHIRQMVRQGKQEIAIQLYVLNVIMLVFGAAFSFILARWTLHPIERSVEAQSRFVSDASHELRTPLTAIQTTNEVALRRKKLNLTEAREVIENNLEDVRRLQRMTSMLLELASDDRDIVTTSTPVHEIIARTLTDIAPAAMGRDISIDDQTRNRNIMADADTAAQALTIILDNAIKYSDPGATITLTTKPQRRTMLAISVRDYGPGIAPDDQKRIFSRFYRSDEARSRVGAGGYGLGLEIAQKIARAHGGTIELESKLGHGSTFSLVLPVAKKVAENTSRTRGVQ